MRPHKDLPAGSQKWAEDVDKMEQRIKDLEALVKRLSEMLRVDSTRPGLNVNPQGIAPAANSADKQKLSGLADTDTYNVADKQLLSWSQDKQAWSPWTFNGVELIHPRDSSWIVSPIAVGLDIPPTVDAPQGWYGWNAQGEMEMRSIATIGADEFVCDIAMMGDKLYIFSGPWSTSGNGAQIILNARTGVVDLAEGTNGVGIPAFTTATRPTAALTSGTVATAVVIFDSDLSKPIVWHWDSLTNTGTWRDFNGTTV